MSLKLSRLLFELGEYKASDISRCVPIGKQYTGLAIPLYEASYTRNGWDGGVFKI